MHFIFFFISTDYELVNLGLFLTAPSAMVTQTRQINDKYTLWEMIKTRSLYTDYLA